VLTAAGLVKRYGRTAVLEGASLTCERGQAVCLAGANAAGKTTLLTIAAGLQKPDAGKVFCDGTIGYVPQELSLLTDLSVRDNLLLWYAAAGRPAREVFSQNALETQLGLSPYARRTVRKLSGGLKKRAEIACALARRPAYLLMDEPFNGLDLASREEIVQLLCRLKSEGAGLLFSSHDPHQIAASADSVILLKDHQTLAPQKLEGDLSARTAQVITLLSRA